MTPSIHQDHRMHWEEEAFGILEYLIGGAQFDNAGCTILLPPIHDDGRRPWKTCSTIQELQTALTEAFDESWYANVPFDGGEAVFHSDALAVVDDILDSNPQFSAFFED